MEYTKPELTHSAFATTAIQGLKLIGCFDCEHPNAPPASVAAYEADE